MLPKTKHQTHINLLAPVSVVAAILLSLSISHKHSDMESVVSKIPHMKVQCVQVKEKLTIDDLYESIDLYDMLIDSVAVLEDGYDTQILKCYQACRDYCRSYIKTGIYGVELVDVKFMTTRATRTTGNMIIPYPGNRKKAVISAYESGQRVEYTDKCWAVLNGGRWDKLDAPYILQAIKQQGGDDAI